MLATLSWYIDVLRQATIGCIVIVALTFAILGPTKGREYYLAARGRWPAARRIGLLMAIGLEALAVSLVLLALCQWLNVVSGQMTIIVAWPVFIVAVVILGIGVPALCGGLGLTIYSRLRYGPAQEPAAR